MNSNNGNSILSDEGLKRTIGVWGLGANIVNITIGAGIFVLPAIVAAGLGSASVLAYLLCGVLIALVMLCFAEAGSKVTETGGAYAYIESAFGNYAGFLTANLFIISALTANGAVANAIADIIATYFPAMSYGWVRILFFLIMSAGLAWINIVGIRTGMRLVFFITVLKLAPLLLLILVGWKDVVFSNLLWDSVPSLRSVGEMSLILFFAFQGSEVGLTIGGEVRSPRKTIPKGVLLGVGGVLLIYTLIQVVSQGVLGSSLPEFQENPLAQVGNVLFGPIGLTLLTVGAAVSMFGNLSGMVTNMPRIVYAGARDHVIPPYILARIHPKYATPHVAIIVYAGAVFILSVIGGLEALMIASSGTALLVYIGVALAVLKLRKNQPADSETFRIPGGAIIPILTVISILWFLAHLSGQDVIGMVIMMAVLTAIFFGMKWVRSKNLAP